MRRPAACTRRAGSSTVGAAVAEAIPYILATAGHVDHGKSTLVRALTGVDPDRLPEEKARGITIDLGFAAVELAAGEGRAVRLGIVDVPGHEDFVKNMVAGIGSVDVALLAVAADDGWMPQTEEHLQILGYQGVTRGVVALTKIDLAGDEAAVLAAVRERLAGSCLAGAAIVPTSVVSGRGLDQLRAALAAAAVAGPPRADVGKPRLAVDRAFAVRGVGTVLTGTLTGGRLNRGQNVVAEPGGVRAKVRSVQSHNRDVAVAVPGSRVAVNVPELAGVGRGATVVGADGGGASDTLDVWLERSARAGAGAVGHGARVWVHHGTAAVAGRVFLFDRTPVGSGQGGAAQVRLASPVYAWVGDRLVVRDASQQHTLAGGRVLDVGGDRRGYRRRRATVMGRVSGELDDLILAELADHGAVLRASLLVRSAFATAAVAAGVDALAAGRRLVVAGAWAVDVGRWSEWGGRLAEAVDVEHRDSPAHLGLAVSVLRGVVSAPEAVVEALIAAMVAGGGFVRRGATVARATHRAALPAELAAAGARVRGALAAKPLEPPNRRELTPTSVDRAALQFLIDTGEAIAVGDELVLLADAVERAAAVVRRHVGERGPASASDLKVALGTTRRVVVPLLELLDRRGVTRRVGDLRDVR